MIRFVEHNEVDTDKWDKCVKRSINSTPYAFSWYLDIVVSHWNALIFNDYEAVFPLPTRKKWGVQYAFTPFWVQQLGLISQTKEGLDRIDDFIAAIPNQYRFLELNMNHIAPVKDSLNYQIRDNFNYVLPLNKPYQLQKEAYSKNLKRNLKKADLKGLQLFKHDAPQNLIQLFRSDKGQSIAHFTEADYKNLEQIMHVAINKHCGEIWMAYGEGNRALAGFFLLFGPKRVVLLFTGNSIEGKEHAAMPFLIDEFIKTSANSSFLFDFEGSNDENLARFYKSFGAVNQGYQNLKINRLPLLLRFMK